MAGAVWLGRTCGQGLHGKREDSIFNPSPVSLPPYFPLGIYSFQGRDNLHVYQIPLHFPLPGTRKILFLVCLAVRFHHVTRFCPIECISLSQFWPIKPSAETLLPSLLFRQPLSRLKRQSYSMDYLLDPASACRGQLPWGVLFSPH